MDNVIITKDCLTLTGFIGDKLFYFCALVVAVARNRLGIQAAWCHVSSMRGSVNSEFAGTMTMN